MRINVRTVLDQAEKRKTEVKPLPKVKIRASESNSASSETSPKSIGVSEQLRESIGYKYVDKQGLIDELQADLVKVKKVRAVLSSQNWKLVQGIEERLRSDNPSAAEAFLDGKLRVPELQEHAARIEALTDQGARIYDDLEHVKLHGKRPETVDPIPTQEASRDAKALNYEIRRLDDRIHKTRKKITNGKPKNPLRVALWNQKIAFDEARRDELRHELKKLHYGSRTERTSAGEL